MPTTRFFKEKFVLPSVFFPFSNPACVGDFLPDFLRDAETRHALSLRATPYNFHKNNSTYVYF
jgi:hypothetical protein